jgi:hypothetical protein
MARNVPRQMLSHFSDGEVPALVELGRRAIGPVAVDEGAACAAAEPPVGVGGAECSLALASPARASVGFRPICIVRAAERRTPMSQHNSVIVRPRARIAHNPLTAKLAAEAGFDAIWGSGFELSAAYAVPDRR